MARRTAVFHRLLCMTIPSWTVTRTVLHLALAGTRRCAGRRAGVSPRATASGVWGWAVEMAGTARRQIVWPERVADDRGPWSHHCNQRYRILGVRAAAEAVVVVLRGPAI